MNGYLAWVRSCSTAPALNVSQAAIRTFKPPFCSVTRKKPFRGKNVWCSVDTNNTIYIYTYTWHALGGNDTTVACRNPKAYEHGAVTLFSRPHPRGSLRQDKSSCKIRWGPFMHGRERPFHL